MKSILKEELKEINKHHFIEKIHMLIALQKKLGVEAVDIAMEVLYEDTFEEWKEIADLHEENDISELVHLLWEHYGKSSGFEFESERIEDGIIVKCQKCPLADMAKAIGEPEWGFKFYCAKDPYIVKGFNSDINLERTNTIMEGHDHCDFKYTYKK